GAWGGGGAGAGGGGPAPPPLAVARARDLCRGSLVVVLLCAGLAQSWADVGVPPGVREVGFDQHPGAAIDAGLPFRDETGMSIRLGDYLGRRPLLLVPAYYGCPML